MKDIFNNQNRVGTSYKLAPAGDTQKTAVSTNELPAGMYFLKSLDRNRLFTQKIIIQ